MINKYLVVASLYDGGWRNSDRNDLIREYELDEELADEICEGLKEMEREILKNERDKKNN